eukprot:g826.t1
MKVGGRYHQTRVMLAVGILFLLLQRYLCAAGNGPWFNGWCTRITDLEQQRYLGSGLLGSSQGHHAAWGRLGHEADQRRPCEEFVDFAHREVLDQCLELDDGPPAASADRVFMFWGMKVTHYERTHTTHLIHPYLDVVPPVATRVDGCNGTLLLTALSGHRRLELRVSAPAESFSEQIYVPTTDGFSREPGSSESHTALAVVRLYDRRKGLRPIEYAIFRQAALERNGASNDKSDGSGSGRRCRIRSEQGKEQATTTTPRPASASLLAPTAAALVAAAAAFSVRKARRKRSLQEGIADFYDASTGVWVEIWGDHLHHGYYEDNSWRPGTIGTGEARRSSAKPKLAPKSVKSLEEAVTILQEQYEHIEEVKVDGLSSVSTVLDVGCGVGGSSRYLQKKYGAKVTGITLSPKQCAQAQELSRKTGQEERCDFQVADALKMPFADDSFDLIWSLESGEHMPRKAEFMAEMHRVCKPGGRIILEQRLLDSISKAYHLPDWCSIADYRQIAQEQLGMTGLRTDDWSQYIAPFWSAVIRSALQPRGWWALLRGGLETFRGALVMPLMNRGYRTGTIRFALLTGLKTGGATGSAPGEEYIHLEVMVLLMRLV